MNVVSVRINGAEYNLKGEEKEEYLHRVAGYVDKKVKTVLANNNQLSTSAAAVLTALNVADEFFKSQQNYEELIEKMGNLSRSESSHKAQIEDLKKHIKNLEDYNTELQERLSKDKVNDLLEQKEQENKKLIDEIEILRETAKQYKEEKEILKSANKEMKFQIQSSKYKIMDLQNKLIENQIDLVKIKKKENSLLNVK